MRRPALYPTPEIIPAYLDEQPRAHRNTAAELAHDLYIRGRPLASTVAAIPIAAHQESPNIMHAMSQYASQRNARPFSVVLYPNHPPKASRQEIRQTAKAIEDAKNAFPHLDLRSTRIDSLYRNQTIGAIRKNLWDATLSLALHDGSFREHGDVICMNHDIDTEYISPNYFRRVQSTVFEDIRTSHPLELPPYGTYIKHSWDNQRPHSSKVVFWQDLANRHYGPTGSYTAGFVTTLQRYATKRGFNKRLNNYETYPLVDDDWIKMIPGTSMATSARRFQDRLHANSLKEVWTEESFTSSDQCRTEQATDISNDHAKELIDSSLDTFMPRFFMNIIKGPKWEFPLSRRALHHDITIKKNVALHALRDILDFPDIAQKADELYPISRLEGAIHQHALRQRR